MDQALETRIRRLIDEDDIREVMRRYARGIDRRDSELVESAFHPGAGAGVEGSAKNLADYMLQLTPDDPCYTHYLCNQLIEVDGDKAYSETYFISVWDVETDGKWHTRFRGGRYLDQFEKRGGVWKIANRLTVDDWDRLDEIKRRARGLQSHAHQIGEGKKRGQPRPTDLVYHMREPR